MTLIETLYGMVDSGRVPHAIMLHEDDGGGGVQLALEFLTHLYGDDSKVARLIHPDVHSIFPITAGHISEDYAREWRSLVTSRPDFTEDDLNESLGITGKSTSIAVAESKALVATMGLSALEGGYRTALIYLPEKMNQEAANRLLKLVEEPPRLTQFVFVTHSPEKVLKTIISRCQLLRVPPRQRVRVRTEFEEFSLLMDALKSGDLSAALEVGEALAALPSRENSKAFCKFAGDRLRSVFLIQQGLDTLAGDDPQAAGWAASFARTFPRAAMADLDRAAMLIDRNVNQKILFTDLVNRMYLHLSRRNG